jgi:NADH:ubiquinone oxidoreductase subunit 5 (subunit L)/multisubunit Na+/H+ antiporter MnhA subunit
MLEYLALLLLVCGLLIAGFLSATASRAIADQDYEDDDQLKSVHSSAAWSAAIAFIVSLLVIIVGITMFFKSEAIKEMSYVPSASTSIIIAGILLLVGTLVDAIISSMATRKAGDWIEMNEDVVEDISLVEGAKSKLLTSSIIGFFALAISIGILVWFFKRNSDSSSEETEEKDE